MTDSPNTPNLPSPTPTNNNNIPLSGVQVIFAMIVAFGLILAINFSSRITAGQPLVERFEQISTEVGELREEQATLFAVRDYSQSDAYVEEWARSEGKMLRDGEILVVPVPAGAVAAPTLVPIPTVPVQTSPPQPENWMLWWALFFDSPPPVP